MYDGAQAAADQLKMKYSTLEGVARVLDEKSKAAQEVASKAVEAYQRAAQLDEALAAQNGEEEGENPAHQLLRETAEEKQKTAKLAAETADKAQQD